MRAIGAGARVFGLLSREPAIPPDSGIAIDKSRRGVLRYEGVRFEYPSRPDTRILADFSIEVGVGESVAIVCADSTSVFATDADCVRSQWAERDGQVEYPISIAQIL